MNIYTMSVDKFGHHSRGFPRNIPKVTFPHTPDGDINAENVKISNVKDPSENSDAATKKYVDIQLLELRNSLYSKIDEINLHNVLIQQLNTNLEDLAKGLKEVEHAKIPAMQTHITLLQNKIQEIDVFISRNPPVAARDMVTKKYLDDMIVVTKDFIRKEFQTKYNGISKQILDFKNVISGDMNSKKINIH